MKHQNKFLVNLLSGLTHKQIFFVIWFAVVGGFVLLMIAYYRKNTRSNFRRLEDDPPPPKIPIDAKRLGTQNHDVAVRKDNSPTRK